LAGHPADEARRMIRTLSRHCGAIRLETDAE